MNRDLIVLMALAACVITLVLAWLAESGMTMDRFFRRLCTVEENHELLRSYGFEGHSTSSVVLEAEAILAMPE